MSTPKPKLRINRDILRVLNEALAHCNMNGQGDDERGTCGVAKEHREAMRVYIESWIAAPLSLAIAAIEGEERGERHVRAMRNHLTNEPAAFLRRFQ